MSKQVVVEKTERLSQFLTKNETQTFLNSMLQEKKDKFVTNLISLVSQNQALQKCTPLSLMSGAIVATSLNLSLNKSFGYAYLVPFKNKKTDTEEAQFQVGYKGYIQLAMRTGQYQRLNAVPIYKSQFKSWNALTEDLKLSEFYDYEDDEVVGYVAYFRLNNGFEKTIFWSYNKMLKHADKYSQAFNANSYQLLKDHKIAQADMWKYSSFWYKNFDDMALKTMLRQLLSKYGILNEEIEKAYITDQAVMNKDKPTYVDNTEERIPISKPKKQEDTFNVDSQTGEILEANIEDI